MSLNCVIADAIYDKGKYIYTKAEQLENRGLFPVIFVPSQARMTAEQEYLEYTNKKGMLNTDITTTSRYMSKILDGNTYKKEYITDEIKRIYIKKIIGESKSECKIFSKIIDKPSFVDIVISYIDSMKKENIDLSKLDDIKLENNITLMKLKEITHIKELVEEQIEKDYVDSIDMIDIFTKYVLENKNEFQGKEIFFHGYNNFSKKELDIIKSFLYIGLNVTVTLTLPFEHIKNQSLNDTIFEISHKTYLELLDLAESIETDFNVVNITDVYKMNQDVKYLATHIFGNSYESYDKKSSNVILRLEKNQNDEIENIAQDILNKIREDESLRFNDFAIYTNNFDEYKFCIKRIFEEYEIAYSFDDKTEAQFSNLAIYILTLLKMANEGIDISKLMIFLKTGLCDIQPADLNYLENYLMEFGIKGYGISKEFKKNNKQEDSVKLVYDLDSLNRTRVQIIESINSFIQKIKASNSATEIIQVLYNHLTENNVIKNYSTQIATTSGFSKKQTDIKKQIVHIIYEIFDNISKVDIREDMKLETFVDLFEFSLMDRTVKTIPMTIDQVEICDINKTRILPKKYVYMIGAYENGFPKISDEDVLFSDRELSMLKEQNIEIKQSSLVRTNMALFNVYMAFSNVKGTLIVTMPCSKTTGEPLRPGIIINEIKRILNVPLEGNVLDSNDGKFDAKKMTTKVMFRNLLEKIVDVDNISEGELNYLYNLHIFLSLKDDRYKKILEYARKDDNLSEGTLEMIYNKDINSSVSRLESFKKCPFAYYANYVLNLKPRKRYEMSVLDMGSLMHDVLEKFSKWILERSILWPEIINSDEVKEKAKNKINEIVDKIFEEAYVKYKENSKYIVLKANLKRKMFKVVTIIATSFNQSDFKPLGYEIEFKNGSLYSPIEVNLENGKTMHLVGKIDRVDTATINDKIYIRVVDYKSSNRNISLADVKEGISLQLMTYMSALINNKEKVDKDKEVLPAAINYFSLKTSIKRLEQYEADEEKIHKELIKEMKLKGIYVSDVKVLEAVDRKYKDPTASFIDVNSRNINDENKVMAEDKFSLECNEIQKTLKQIGKEITKGVVKIKPKKCNNKLPCEYCDYLSICRKDIRA